MKTKFKGIVWAGVRTDKFSELVEFYQDKMGLPVAHEVEGFRAFDLPNGDRLEVFAEDYVYKGDDYKHFPVGAVVGFLVDDIEEARSEMEAEGIEFIGEIKVGGKSKWSHFRGVDGNRYELKQLVD